MRILAVSDFYPPVFGGMQRHVQTLSRELVRRGHDVAVAALEHPGSPPFELDEGVRVYRIGGFNRVLKPFYQSPERPFHPTVPDPGVMFALRRVLLQEQPDIVHARGWIIYSALALKRFSNAAMVVTMHDYGLVCAKRTLLHRGAICSGPAYVKCVKCAAKPMGWGKSLGVTSGLRLSRPLHGEVDRYIALNTGLAAACAGRPGTRGKRVDVIPSLVPDRIVQVAEAAPRPDFVPADADYLLYVGGVDQHKGLDVLLRAHAELEHRVPLVIVATPPVDNVPDLATDVAFVEGADHDIVMGAWAHCLLGVVPSTWAEPFGQVAVEAMTCGKAVVASELGGLADIVDDGKTGLLVPPGDHRALRLALDGLLADPSRRAAMGEAGRRRARRYFASAVAAQIEGVYREVLDERELGAARSTDA